MLFTRVFLRLVFSSYHSFFGVGWCLGLGPRSVTQFKLHISLQLDHYCLRQPLLTGVGHSPVCFSVFLFVCLSLSRIIFKELLVDYHDTWEPVNSLWSGEELTKLWKWPGTHSAHSGNRKFNSVVNVILNFISYSCYSTKKLTTLQKLSRRLNR